MSSTMVLLVLFWYCCCCCIIVLSTTTLAFSPISTSTTRRTTTTSPLSWKPLSSSSSILVQKKDHNNDRCRRTHHHHHHHDTTILYMAGGFEWEDPMEAYEREGIENPFKNPELMKKKNIDSNEDGDNDSETMKIDPARLLGPRLNGVNLYLIGMMGSGKSSIGDIVARRMGTYNFLDTDEIIEKATGLKIPEIFHQEGEDGFRKVESQVLDSVHSYVRCVVSTGGGLVTKLENWGKLQSGIVIWLDVDPTTIMERIQGTDRPLLQTDDPLQTLQDLLQERKSKYSQADLRIEVTSDMDQDEVASKIVYELHNYIDENPPAWKLAQEKAKNEGLDWVK